MANKQLSSEEVSIIKGIMRHYPEITSQEIQSWFSSPGRLINSGRFSEIKNKHPRYADVLPSTKVLADKFVRRARGASALAQLTDQRYLPGVESRRTEDFFDSALKVEIGALTARALTQESASVEFKWFYDKSSICVYIRTLSAMLNSGNPGGIFFGVRDDGEIYGVLDHVPEDAFHREIKGFFEPFYEVRVEQTQVGDRQLVYVKTISMPDIPVICHKTKAVSDKTILEEGAIYYRYGSNTEKIKYAELRGMIDAKVDAEAKRRRLL